MNDTSTEEGTQGIVDDCLPETGQEVSIEPVEGTEPSVDAPEPTEAVETESNEGHSNITR